MLCSINAHGVAAMGAFIVGGSFSPIGEGVPDDNDN